MNNDERVTDLTCIDIDGKTMLYGVIGNPVKHSFSPRMHSLAFQKLCINAVYVPFLIQEDHLPGLMNAFSIIGIQGFNITLPFKEKIVPYLDSLSEEAELLQSVNTVIKTHGGWKGYSTDGSGFMRSLAAAKIALSQKKVLLAGAGGAARAIAVSLAKAGVAEISIVNRTQQKAEKLADLIYRVSPALAVRTAISRDSSPDIVINTTSVGMNDDKCPLADEILQDCKWIIDIIYNPPVTPLLKKAIGRSISHMNGLDMLLYQGVEAFEIWTGQKAPVDIMRQSLIASVYPDTNGDASLS